MKSEKLMDYIGQIDDRIIAEANICPVNTKPGKRPWFKWAAIAAVACLVFAATLIINPARPPVPVDSSGLPKLTVNTWFGSMGFEGLLAYDVSELINGNPWTEDNNLTTMPVFTNPYEYDEAGLPVNGLSPEEMLEKAKNAANLFNLEITSLFTEPTQEQIEKIKQKLESVDSSEEDVRRNTSVYRATAECPGAKIEVQSDGHILLELTPETADLAKEIQKLRGYGNFSISFEYGFETIGDTMYGIGFPLPDGYSFAFGNTSHEQAMETTRYLFSEYGAFTGITTPGYDLAADYTYNGVLTRLYTSVFENTGSLTQRILNYHFDRLYFTATDLGGLGGIRYSKTDLSQKIGDYPIITAKEARSLLLENRYITTVPEELPGGEFIARVELMYRTGKYDSVFMPYYRFLVEMPSLERENGLKTFGVFYVPAVRSEFIEPY